LSQVENINIILLSPS